MRCEAAAVVARWRGACPQASETPAYHSCSTPPLRSTPPPRSSCLSWCLRVGRGGVVVFRLSAPGRAVDGDESSTRRRTVHFADGIRTSRPRPEGGARSETRRTWIPRGRAVPAARLGGGRVGSQPSQPRGGGRALVWVKGKARAQWRPTEASTVFPAPRAFKTAGAPRLEASGSIPTLRTHPRDRSQATWRNSRGKLQRFVDLCLPHPGHGAQAPCG